MPGNGVVLVQFTMEHYHAAYRLWSACEGIWLGDPDSEAGIARYLARNAGLSVVGLDGTEVVGALLAGHDGRRGYLHHLAVHPEYRRRGIANRMLDHSLELLRREGITKTHGFVFRTNVEGLRFWERLEWEIREDVLLISTGQ